jgi:predicted nuclease with TOPRIM domain
MPSEERRRSTDRLSPKRIALGTLLSLLPALPAVNTALTYYEQWVNMKVEIQRDRNEIDRLLKENQSLQGLLEDADDRLTLLERWQCRLGWNPPETRNRDRDCGRGND